MKHPITSKDVAAAAGVSQSTVSLVLSGKPGKKIREETRELVRRTALELGYRLNLQAQAMRRRKARTIGLLSTWETNSFVFSPVLNGLKEVCDQEGLALMICSGRVDSDGIPDYVAYHMENRIDGLVYLAHVGVPGDGVIRLLQEHAIPFSCAIGAQDLKDVSSVDSDFTENGRLAAEHLISAGCRHPVLCIDPEANLAERDRTQGFTAACTAAGISAKIVAPPGTDSARNIFSSPDAWSRPNVESANDAMIRAFASILLENPQMDGFSAVSPFALLMMRAAAGEGVPVPGRLKVISLDNEAFAPFVTPSLSTVDEPLMDVGRISGQMLLRLLDGGTPGEKEALPLTVSIRQSSG